MSAIVAGAAMLCCAPASANVIYTLTFYDDWSFSTVQGTAVLELNFATVAAGYNYNGSLAPVLVSLTTSNLNGHGTYSITPANLNAPSQFQTGAAGQMYTLTATQAGSGAASVLFLDLYTNVWQLHNGYWNGPTADDGTFKISGPTLKAAPVPGPLAGAGLPGLMIAGAGFLAWRRRRNDRVGAAAD